jgi:hypothetical protein
VTYHRAQAPTYLKVTERHGERVKIRGHEGEAAWAAAADRDLAGALAPGRGRIVEADVKLLARARLWGQKSGSIRGAIYRSRRYKSVCKVD